MPESTQSTPSAAPAGSASDADLLAQTAIAVRAAASVLRERFGDVVRHRTREELMRALAANDDAALGVLRPRLTLLRPDARFVEDELAGGALPPANGGFWIRPKATSTTCTRCRNGRSPPRSYATTSRYSPRCTCR